MAVNRKRKPAPEDGEATIAANRPVSFTITLDGAAKLSPASSGVPAQKRTRRVVETQLGGGIGATVSNDDEEEEDSALVLTAGDIDGVPSFEGTLPRSRFLGSLGICCLSSFVAYSS